MIKGFSFYQRDVRYRRSLLAVLVVILHFALSACESMAEQPAMPDIR